MFFGWKQLRSCGRAFAPPVFAMGVACALPLFAPVFGGAAFCRGKGPGVQSQEPVLHVEVNLQPIEVQVTDSHGNNVRGLSAKDFTLFEDGRPQRIAFFDAGKGPVSIAVLVDSSNSMISQSRFGSAQEVAAQFMRTARPDDQVWAMDFTDQTGPWQRLTPPQLLNPSSFSLAPASGEGSALYDAIATALCHLRASKNPRQAVIVVTDGDDQYSRISLDQLIDLVRSSRAQLFMIGLESRPRFNFQGHKEKKLTLVTGHDIDNPVVVFDRLMKESGAESFIPKSKRDLNEALKAVSNMLESEYTLAYYPEKASKNLRKIKVKVDRHGAHILTRRFVGSEQEAAESIHFKKGTCFVSPKFYPYPYESKLTYGPKGMVYREDFSDPHSGWPNHKDSHYISGGYELLNPEAQSGYSGVTGLSPSWMPVTSYVPKGKFRENVVAAYGPFWSDFRASVDMDAVLKGRSYERSAKFHHKGRPAAGLVFRMSNEGYYALLVHGMGKRKKLSVELVRREFSLHTYTERELIPWTSIDKGSVSAAKLSVEVVGNQITVFVNGQEIKTVQDDTFDSGLVGFVISGPGQAIFRNLMIEQE